MKKLPEYDFPHDIGEMTLKELELLAVEIREFLIDNISVTGGHLASNLGAVELTIALMKCFSFPEDKIIWDVGHQSYVYKILTGRAGKFHTLRQSGGISGFPKRAESEYDFFDTGHSSNSISAAAGFAVARDMKGGNYQIVSVIGDGAMTGGLAYEGLNNLAGLKSRSIVVLNDNGMSIGRNTGGLSRHLAKIRVSSGYSSFKSRFRTFSKKVPGIGDRIYDTAVRLRDHLKYSIVDSVMFEQLGFTCIGPVDGHDISALIEAFRLAAGADGPVLVHVITRKGKGYLNAEKNPSRFHGTGAFDKSTGEPLEKKKGPSYSEIYGRKLVELAEKDKRITAVSAAMISGTGLSGFAERFPDRIFDTGIAEGHAVTFSGSMALSGMKPFTTIYSTFLQRAYDNIIMDVCLQNAPVVLGIDRAGNVGADGETHHGMFDIPYLRCVPNMTVLTPSCGRELEVMMEFAAEAESPVAIRYPRGTAPVWYDDFGFHVTDEDRSPLRSRILLEGEDVMIWSCGAMLDTAAEVCGILRSEGISAGLCDARCVVPLDRKTLSECFEMADLVATIEDGVTDGGAGEACKVLASDLGIDTHIISFGWPKEFIAHGTTAELRKLHGLDSRSVAERIKETIERQTGCTSR